MIGNGAKAVTVGTAAAKRVKGIGRAAYKKQTFFLYDVCIHPFELLNSS